MNKSKITIDAVKAVFKAKGYSFFENDSKNYNLNIFGVRSSDMTPNLFNDCVCLAWKFNGEWNLKIYDATTDPGLYYLEQPMNVNGTAIMHPGQYSKCYEVGLHKGYTALRQVKPMKYYRDSDRDKAFDLNESKIYEEIGFTDIHHASQTGKSTNVDNWSAGCQVIADIKNWNEFIGLCQESVKIFGNSFTYTLINEKDLDDIKVVA